MSELLTTVDVGRLAEITHCGVSAAAKRGEITPTATTPNGTLLFTRKEAERYASERRARMEGRKRG